MTNASEDLLTTTEGVDEGSAASTVEGPDSSGPEAAGAGRQTDPRSHVHGDGEGQPAPPQVVESPESRSAHATDTGQQLSVGEG